MTVMNESGPPPGIATIRIKTDRESGYVWIIDLQRRRSNPKSSMIPIGTSTKPEASLLMLEFDNAQIIAASKSNVVIKF